VVDGLSHYIDVALLIVALYLIYRGVTSPKRGPWDARRITAAGGPRSASHPHRAVAGVICWRRTNGQGPSWAGICPGT